jgi:hypothetical protein
MNKVVEPEEEEEEEEYRNLQFLYTENTFHFCHINQLVIALFKEISLFIMSIV